MENIGEASSSETYLTMRVLVVILIMVISVRGEEIITATVKNVSKPVGWVGLGVDHTIKKRKAANHNHNSYAAPVSTSYGSPGAAAEDSVDLHNKEFCVDVSTYQPVVWEERDGEEYNTDFVKECKDKCEDDCAEVTETFVR